MPRLRVHCFAVSLDGFAAGPHQSLENPMGVGGMALHQWVFPTRTFQRLHADMGLGANNGGGSTGVDDNFAARGFEGLGAWILGRNMFGPIRGPWPDDAWKGWWGESPPYRTPVFVLTHHARAPITMQGGTTFHFVTGGLREAYDRAMDAAKGRDVRLGGGTATVRQALESCLVDEMHVAISPTLLGAGEHLWRGLDLGATGYSVTEQTPSESVMHVVIRRNA